MARDRSCVMPSAHAEKRMEQRLAARLQAPPAMLSSRIRPRGCREDRPPCVAESGDQQPSQRRATRMPDRVKSRWFTAIAGPSRSPAVPQGHGGAVGRPILHPANRQTTGRSGRSPRRSRPVPRQAGAHSIGGLPVPAGALRLGERGDREVEQHCGPGGGRSAGGGRHRLPARGPPITKAIQRGAWIAWSGWAVRDDLRAGPRQHGRPSDGS